MITKRLAEAEEHVALGEEYIARLREILDELRRDGRATVDAQKLLDNFLSIQEIHVNDRDRLREKLAAP